MTTGCKLYFNIDAPFQRYVDEGWLQQIVNKALAIEGVDYPVELSVVITNAEVIRRLNSDYRGRDEDTDVLAFALSGVASDTSFVSPPDGVARLGEVLVSYAQAEIQAREHKHSIQQELALLVTHGVLHLLGYDHDDKASSARMRSQEERVLEGLRDGHLL